MKFQGELSELKEIMDISEENLDTNTWYCRICKVEWSNSIKPCRKCDLREFKEKRREKYLKK